MRTPESPDERRQYMDDCQIELRIYLYNIEGKNKLLTGMFWCCDLDLVHLPPQMGPCRHPVKVPKGIGRHI